MTTSTSIIPADAVNLRESAESFDLLFNSMDSCYLITDAAYRVLFFNEAAKNWFLKFHGISLQKDICLIDEYTDPVKKERGVAALNKAISGENISYEFSYDSEGESFWFLSRIFPMYSNGKISGICIYVNDISERKNRESELKESNDRYNYVSKVTSDAIYDWNMITNSLYFNNTYRILFGINENDESNHIANWENRIHADDRKYVRRSLEELMSDPTRHYFEAEYRYLKNDGTYAYVLDRGHIIHNTEHKPIRMIGSMQDITTRKLYEIEREKMTADLIQRNQDLEQFAFIVSHNLRSHVANILGLSELVNSGLLGGEEKDSIFKTLNVSAKKLDGVIKDLSLILQVKRDISEKKQKVQFAELVHDVQVSLHNHIEKEQAEIITNFRGADNLYTVKSYMYSIIHNLISNSLKYRKSNVSPVIKIYSETTEENIVLYYKDNGLGIDMNMHGNNVFGLYKRFHPNTEGKGMGLFMVKTQVEALGGKIDLRSSANEGVQFTIKFRKSDS